jgi:hypothetical protein
MATVMRWISSTYGRYKPHQHNSYIHNVFGETETNLTRFESFEETSLHNQSINKPKSNDLQILYSLFDEFERLRLEDFVDTANSHGREGNMVKRVAGVLNHCDGGTGRVSQPNGPNEPTGAQEAGEARGDPQQPLKTPIFNKEHAWFYTVGFCCRQIKVPS